MILRKKTRPIRKNIITGHFIRIASRDEHTLCSIEDVPLADTGDTHQATSYEAMTAVLEQYNLSSSSLGMCTFTEGSIFLDPSGPPNVLPFLRQEN